MTTEQQPQTDLVQDHNHLVNIPSFQIPQFTRIAQAVPAKKPVPQN